MHNTDISPIPPITIEVGESGTNFKSINKLIWENIPGFTVLTGLNGAGKSQLLEILAYKITGTARPQDGHQIALSVKVTGENYQPDDKAYLPTSGTYLPDAHVGVSTLQNIKQQLYDQLQPQNIASNLQLKARRARLEKFFAVSNLNSISKEDFVKRLPDDYAYWKMKM